MREIKFRYRFKERSTGKIITDILSIQDVEGQNFEPKVFDFIIWEILSRDEYIGRKEKNGKEIFEGDVVKVLGYYQSHFIVEYLTDGFKLVDGKDGFLGEIRYWEQVEVIGNIHENPELADA